MNRLPSPDEILAWLRDNPGQGAKRDIARAFGLKGQAKVELKQLLARMTIEQAADAVAAFQPGEVYPYHSKGSDIEAFAKLVAAGAPDTEVLIRNWYPGA